MYLNPALLSGFHSLKSNKSADQVFSKPPTSVFLFQNFFCSFGKDFVC